MNNLEFENLLQPMALTAFFEKYWEKLPLYIHREIPKRYSELISLKDIDSIICNNKANFQIFDYGELSTSNSNSVYNLFI